MGGNTQNNEEEESPQGFPASTRSHVNSTIITLQKLPLSLSRVVGEKSTRRGGTVKEKEVLTPLLPRIMYNLNLRNVYLRTGFLHSHRFKLSKNQN